MSGEYGTILPQRTERKQMKVFTKDDVGVIVLGASQNNPVEQNLKILELATKYGYPMTEQELEMAWEDYRDSNGDLPIEWYETLGEEIEFALAYLIDLCNSEVSIEFEDTDLILTTQGYTDLTSVR